MLQGRTLEDDRPLVGNVAEEATADFIRGQRLAQVFRQVRRVNGMAGSDIPERPRLVAIMGEPKLASLPIVVAADEGQPAVSRPESIIDDRMEHLPFRVSFLLQPVGPDPSKSVRDLRLARLGNRRRWKVQMPELGGPKKGPRVPRALLRGVDGAMTFGARRGSNKPSGLGEQRVLVAERTGLRQAASASLAAPSCRYARLRSQWLSESGA